MYLIILAKLSCGDGFKKILLDNSRNILGRASKALFLTFQGPKNPPVLRSVIIRYFSPWRGSQRVRIRSHRCGTWFCFSGLKKPSLMSDSLESVHYTCNQKAFIFHAMYSSFDVVSYIVRSTFNIQFGKGVKLYFYNRAKGFESSAALLKKSCRLGKLALQTSGETAGAIQLYGNPCFMVDGGPDSILHRENYPKSVLSISNFFCIPRQEGYYAIDKAGCGT